MFHRYTSTASKILIFTLWKDKTFIHTSTITISCHSFSRLNLWEHCLLMVVTHVHRLILKKMLCTYCQRWLLQGSIHINIQFGSCWNANINLFTIDISNIFNTWPIQWCPDTVLIDIITLTPVWKQCFINLNNCFLIVHK